MAESLTTQYTLPPRFLQDFLIGGGPQSGVPGLFPLLNQNLASQFATLGVPGATPFTYQGQRIAPFSQQEQRAFNLTDQAIGSYLPYLRDYEALSRQGLDAGLAGISEAEQLQRRGASEILGGADLASQNIGRGVDMSLAGLGGATSAARGAYGLLSNQLGNTGMTARNALADARNVALGATRQFDPSGISAFMNPYEDLVVQQALDDVRRAGSSADQQRRAQAIDAGAFGGGRSRLLAAELGEAQRKAELETAAGLRASGFNTALDAARTAFENQQRRQAGAASQLGNIAGGIGSLAGQQATAGQNLANMLASYGLSGGAELQNLGATQSALGQLRGGAFGTLGSNLSSLGRNRGAMLTSLGTTLGNIGNRLGQLQRQDISLLGNIGSTQRGMQQGLNDLAYQNFVGQYNLPQTLLGQYGQFAQGIGPLLGQTQFASSSTPDIAYTSSALGGFSDALGRTIANPYGTGG